MFIWALYGQLPHWAIGLVLVGALLFSAYFTWRDEYLALKTHTQQPQQLRAYATGMISVINSYGPTPASSYNWLYVDLKVSILNAGPPTIIENWALELPTGQRVSMRERSLNESLTLDERTRNRLNLLRIVGANL